MCDYKKGALNNPCLRYGIVSVVIFLGSSVAQESVYQVQKKGEKDSAIGTSIRTTSRHHTTASNVSQSCTVYQYAMSGMTHP